MDTKINAKARVQLTVEVDANSPWGAECNIGQLYDQAGREAKERLVSALAKAFPAARIIGEPRVIGIITEAA